MKRLQITIELCIVLGACSMVYGVYQLKPAFAWIAGGLAVILISFGAARAQAGGDDSVE